MSKGILFIVFGDKYYNLAVKTIGYSRKYTNLPIHILTNVKKEWSLANTTCEYINIGTEKNREIKTTMIDRSPFDSTIYLDCDSVIQKPGIEKAFDLMVDYDIMLNLYGTWKDRSKSVYYYNIAMDNLRVEFPLTIYYGAFIGFNKNDKAKQFFKNWNKNWIKSYIEREMPALACTVKQMGSDINIKKTSNSDNFFTWKINKNACVQHEYGKGSTFWDTFFNENN